MKTRSIAYFCVVVGAMMGVQWLFFLATGNVPELETEPLAITFHLAAELIAAAALVIAGVALLRGVRWARPAALTALGMLLYTVVNSAGYFAEQRVWAMVAMFGVLLVVSVFCVAALFKESEL